ncbi:hypothetical protein LMG26846_05673 [Achromobacter insuavis]|uniref:hypothetical protein n=1 Tax=Achromobacter insuavis TaxID=1287735 RepID=UPI001464F26A|nr:hypothetical protein [Achromobacter insuavis]CAB3921971.1 hypothetical protein LMG26846_05673 [Achromobacter insuavis]
MYLLKVFYWKTAPQKFRFRRLMPADDASPLSQCKDSLDVLATDLPTGKAEAAERTWPAQIFLDFPVTMPRDKGS